jgi:hypothetical protein
LSPKLAAKAAETVLERHLDLMRAWLDPTLSAVVLQRANCSCIMPLSTRRSFTRGTPRGLFGRNGLMAFHS